MKEAIQEGAVLKEKIAEIFIYGKNAVSVLNTDQFKRHTGSAFHGIFVSAGGTETAVTAERDKFKVPAERAVVHCAAKRGIAAVDHLIDIIHFSFSGMESIYNFFIMVCKDSL